MTSQVPDGPFREGSPFAPSRNGFHPRDVEAVSGRAGFAAYDSASSRTRALIRWRRRTIAETASVRSVRVSPNRTFSTASHTSSGVSPSSTREAASRRGGPPETEREQVHPQLVGALAPVQPPQLPHPEVAVAPDLALVEARDLGLHHQVGRGTLDERHHRRVSFATGGEVASRPFTDVERAVGLHPRAGWLTRAAEAQGPQPLHRIGDSASRRVDDAVDKLGQVFVLVRGGHQGDDAQHRVEPYPAEVSGPIDHRERADRIGIGTEDVKGGAERSRVHRGAFVHERAPLMLLRGRGGHGAGGTCGVRLRLLADAGAQPLAAEHDRRDGLRPLRAGLAEPHLLHRFAHVRRRQPFEHPGGGEPARRARGTEGEEVHLELVSAFTAAQPPQLPYPEFAIAHDLAFVEARDLGLDDQVGSDTENVVVGRRAALATGIEVALRALADVERAVGLHPRARWLIPSAQAGGTDPSRRARDEASRRIHDMVEEIGQIFVQVRRGHQGDDSLHRVEPYPTEVPVPVHRRERGNGVGVGTQDVDGGAERPRVHRCGVVHEGKPPSVEVSGPTAAMPPDPYSGRGRIAGVHRHRPPSPGPISRRREVQPLSHWERGLG